MKRGRFIESAGSTPNCQDVAAREDVNALIHLFMASGRQFHSLFHYSLVYHKTSLVLPFRSINESPTPRSLTQRNPRLLVRGDQAKVIAFFVRNDDLYSLQAVIRPSSHSCGGFHSDLRSYELSTQGSEGPHQVREESETYLRFSICLHEREVGHSGMIRGE